MARYQISIVEGEYSATGPHYYRASMVDTQTGEEERSSKIVYSYPEAYQEAVNMVRNPAPDLRDVEIVARPPTE